MNLIERAKNILLQPRPTWAAIDAEPADVASLYTNYAMVLAAIPAVCGFIGLSLIGFSAFGVSVRVPLVAGVVNMVLSYVLSLVGIFVLGLIIDALAPTFGGHKSPIQAQKVAVYASTAALVGGVFSLLPALSMLALLAALYSVYLLYTGLPVLMKSASEKSAAYTAVVVVAAIVVGVVMAMVSSLFMPGSAAMLGAAGAPAVTMNTPGGAVSIDTAKLEAAGKKMEEAARQMEQAQKSQDPAAMAAATGNAAAAAAGVLGGGQAVAAQSLKAALPQALSGLQRTSLNVQDGAALGLPTSQASAEYGDGSKQVRLEIIDIGGLGQMAVMAMGMAQGEKEDATSAEKTWQESGRMLHQRHEKDGSHAEFKTVLKNGVVVSIEGDNLSVKDLRAYLAQVDLNALEALQRKGKS
ncbi:Yip1 family protein [Paracidovorax sp. MALMAid1276]|uniref:Yip1 family protein n=1 Tax=Paracidovorax sp. MALMAid1276 TaxID=3411631 RepID=UPI003B9D7621